MENSGIVSAEILLPKAEDKTAWACIACDQFTSEPIYWEQLKKTVGNKPSALNLVLPEIYLENNREERIERINANISEYLKKGYFEKLKKGFILTVRKTPFVERRIGLIGALDLEKYDYSGNVKPLIRATEGTIEERIPPRLKIREKAMAEFPHVMVLFDDEKREITESLYQNRNKYKKLYDFDLNMGGGKIEGYFIDQESLVLEKFSKLLDSDRLIKKYGMEDKFLFAVGDGNHSLATAKAHWNNVKLTLTEKEKENHPARFALVEFNNVYDEGIYFEPIHRIIKGVKAVKFVSGLSEIKADYGVMFGGEVSQKENGVSVPKSISAIDRYIKDYIKENGGTVDYIHGEENLKKLVSEDKNAVGITFKKIDKSYLFKYVSQNGPFPRKTFSMGEGVEKRYYFEGKMIVEE